MSDLTQTWPPRAKGPMWKTPIAVTKKAKKQLRTGRRSKEKSNKDKARDRDNRRCRFPLCGCKGTGLALEVSHDKHKGSGGNPTGDRSKPELLITLCVHRHQTGRVSRHAQNIRTRYLTDRRNNGPVAWELRRDVLHSLGLAAGEARGMWIEVARERAPQLLEELEPWQKTVLKALAEMRL
jgi:hypothetical protein